MFLNDIDMRTLAGWLEPHMAKAAWPGIDTSADRNRIRKWAKTLGVWDRFDKLDPTADIPVVKRSVFRQYQREGIREPGQAALNYPVGQMTQAALALWLGHPKGDLDHVQDLMWSICETTRWVLPAHEHRDGPDLDLGGTRFGLALAETRWLLRDQLEDEVAARVDAELERRMLEAAVDWRQIHWWSTCHMNWNHVCNANLIMIGLYQIRSSAALAQFIHPIIQRLDYAVDGFADDGGCLEGPGYWQYGFGHFVNAATAMHHRTGGMLNLMDDPRVERISAYPLAAYIDPPTRAAFGDGGHGYLQSTLTLQINQFHKLPGLYSVAESRNDGLLDIKDIHGLALYRGEKASPAFEPEDTLLPSLGIARVVQGKGSKRTVLCALAGRNDVPHNHNDIGSFILYKHGQCLLTDPGSPRYTSKTFGPDRYDLIHTRTLGHSAPIIEGSEQAFGGEYNATIQLHADDDAIKAHGGKHVVIDMSQAYPVKSLKSMIRTFTLDSRGGLTIEDDYTFTRKPKSLEEGFVTLHDAKVERGGRSVTIGQGRKSLTLSADAGTKGKFRIDDLTAAIEDGRDGKVVRRIVFVPTSCDKTMTLRFRAE